MARATGVECARVNRLARSGLRRSRWPRASPVRAPPVWPPRPIHRPCSGRVSAVPRLVFGRASPVRAPPVWPPRPIHRPCSGRVYAVPRLVFGRASPVRAPPVWPPRPIHRPCSGRVSAVPRLVFGRASPVRAPPVWPFPGPSIGRAPVACPLCPGWFSVGLVFGRASPVRARHPSGRPGPSIGRAPVACPLCPGWFSVGVLRPGVGDRVGGYQVARRRGISEMLIRSKKFCDPRLNMILTIQAVDSQHAVSHKTGRRLTKTEVPTP